MADQVEVVLGDAHDNVKRLKDPIDVLFLDADKEGYKAYLEQLLPLVRPRGLVMADNISMAPDYYRPSPPNRSWIRSPSEGSASP